MFTRPHVLAICAVVLGTLVHADERRPNPLAAYDASIKPEQRRHWAFQPVKRPVVPTVKDTAWVRNPIDAFVLARLEARGWQPSPTAGKQALLRRVHLDVTGLPPTLAEQERFLNDPSPAALNRVADELLAQPEYGERWARHWLDLVRYADSNGYERDAAKPFAWKYRDYVIRSLNADKPFDRFILEQLAGDELSGADGETLIATGYYRLGPWDDEPADPLEDRYDQLDDLVSTTAQVFLGLTLGCARCHDHKFEPLTMHDYYRMVAIFNPLRRPQRERLELDLPAATPAAVKAAVQHQLSAIRLQLSALGRTAPLLGAASVWARVACPKEVADLPRGYFLHEPSPKAPATHLLVRGKPTRPGPAVEPGLPAVLVSHQPAFLPSDERTSRRRLTLARWVADPANPLTARVIVNRVWQHHFGEGLVRTPSDFGLHGERPTHPELLDWLADWFVKDAGWSLKQLHRLLLTSNAYRMAKRWHAEYGPTDPENRLLWRVPYRRLDAEVVRDSMLAVSGQLNPERYGPGMFPPVPREALAAHSDRDQIWKPSDEREAARRTVYCFVKRTLVVPMLEVLDFCDTARSAAQRPVTTVAPQALSLFNGDFVNQHARYFADRLRREVGDDAARQIDLAYRLALGRRPMTVEHGELVRFLTEKGERGSLEQACRVILNLNEFVYPD